MDGTNQPEPFTKLDYVVGIAQTIGITQRAAEIQGVFGAYLVHSGYAYALTRVLGMRGLLLANAVNIGFEYLQHHGTLGGVGEMADVYSGIGGSILAILQNKFQQKNNN